MQIYVIVIVIVKLFDYIYWPDWYFLKCDRNNYLITFLSSDRDHERIKTSVIV